MDPELKEVLICINENLKAIVENQNVMFFKLKEIEEKIGKQEQKNPSDWQVFKQSTFRREIGGYFFVVDSAEQMEYYFTCAGKQANGRF